MKQRILTMLLFGLLGITSALAQEREITGRVTDPKGEGLPGVSVLVVETKTGNSTDLDGNFKVKATTGNTLRFSLVGSKTVDVKVGDSNTINVSLQEDNVLDDLVLTGYRALEREKFTGSITSVSSKSIDQVPIASFDQILQGRSTGVMVTASSGRPGAGANIRVRGVGTINSSTTPLYVIDGVPISTRSSTSGFETNPMAALNPNDIETMSVLKDASAASIYGARAANGVILITTKKGKEGKMRIDYRTQYGITTRTTGRFNMMNTQEKIAFERLAFDQGLEYGRVGTILASSATPESKEAQINQLAGVNTNWADLFFRSAETQSHEINVSGGNDKVRFYAAGSYRHEDGILILTGLDRYSLRTNVEAKATKNLTFGLNATLGTTKESRIRETGNNLNNPVLYAFSASPYNSPFNADGSYSPGSANDYGVNLYHAMHESKRLPTQTKVLGNIFLDYAFPKIKGLNFKTSLGLDYTQDSENTLVTPQSPNQSGIALGSGFLTRGFARDQTIISTTTLRYSFNIGEKHNISAMLGNEIIKRYFFDMRATGFGLNPQIDFPSTTNGIANTSFTNRETRNSLLSYFADVAYSFDDRYNVSASIRRDGSSRFGQNKKYGYFGSVGAAWNIHNESFYENLGGLSTVLSSANLRGSYGTTGNQEVRDDTQDGFNFNYLPTFTNSSYANSVGIVPSLGNPNYQWEQSATLNLGMDLGFFKNRVKFSVEYYNRTTSALFVNAEISRATGFRNLNLNAGKMRNRGLELSIDADVVQVGKFTWNVNANATFNQNRVLDLGNSGSDFLLVNGYLVKPGYPIGTHYLVKWAGVDPTTGDAQYYDKDGKIGPYNGEAQIPFGTYEPMRYGGFSNKFTYGQLELSIFCSWADGNQLYNVNKAYAQDPLGGGGGNLSKDMLNMWVRPGQVTDIPRVDESIQLGNTNRFLESGAYLRMRNVMLSYTFNDKALKNIKLSAARVYFQAQNLFTITKYDGFDPEAVSGGLGYSNFPVPRVFTVGLDISL